MKQPIRLGIVGSGNMASRMVKALSHAPDYKVQAVASGSAERAQAFAAAFDIPGSFASAKELAENSEIDAVYICNRNRDHVPRMLHQLDRIVSGHSIRNFKRPSLFGILFHLLLDVRENVSN